MRKVIVTLSRGESADGIVDPFLDRAGIKAIVVVVAAAVLAAVADVGDESLSGAA
jgi:hypothetical protein